MNQGPGMVHEPGVARVWDGVGVWACEGTGRQGTGRGQGPGKEHIKAMDGEVAREGTGAWEEQ